MFVFQNQFREVFSPAYVYLANNRLIESSSRCEELQILQVFVNRFKKKKNYAWKIVSKNIRFCIGKCLKNFEKEKLKKFLNYFLKLLEK